MSDLQSQIRGKLHRYLNGPSEPETYVSIANVHTVLSMDTPYGWKALYIVTRDGGYDRYYELTYVASEDKTYMNTYILESQSVILG